VPESADVTSRASRLASRLFLVGPRGSGKTTVARLVAARLGWSHVDADTELERRLGRTIRSIFAAEGDGAFREQEAAILAELCQLENHVVATGGGVVLRPENRLRMQSSGHIVWLTASPETLAARMSRDATTTDRRPSLTGGAGAMSLEEIVAVMTAREPLYHAVADVIVSTEGQTPEQVADAVVAGLREAFS
jgi:shikimate kinase